MRILISGGGVAGMTLAYWLHRHGFTPVVVERSPRGRGDGYGIDFHGTGYDIATRMGIVEELESHRLPVDSVDFVNAEGRTTARLAESLLEKVIQGPHLGLMHSTLERTLTEATEADVEIRYEQTITEVRQTPGSVGVTFADGSSEDFDLLIGADGIHSNTRRLVFGDESRYAHHLGYYLASHPVRDEYDLGRVRVHYSEPGRQVIVYPTGEPGELIALYIFRAPDTGPVPREKRTALLRELYNGMDWITPSLLAQASEEIFMDTMGQIVMPHWHDGRVALIGDACGCMTLVSAQGVSMAMAGAYILAEELREGPDHGSAFARYERRMKPEVTRRQKNARGFAKSLVPATKLGMAAQNIAAGIIMRDAFAPLLRRQFGAMSILPQQPTR